MGGNDGAEDVGGAQGGGEWCPPFQAHPGHFRQLVDGLRGKDRVREQDLLLKTPKRFVHKVHHVQMVAHKVDTLSGLTSA